MAVCIQRERKIFKGFTESDLLEMIKKRPEHICERNNNFTLLQGAIQCGALHGDSLKELRDQLKRKSYFTRKQTTAILEIQANQEEEDYESYDDYL